MGGGLEQFSVSPRPLGFGFGTNGFGAKGLGTGLDNNSCRLHSDRLGNIVIDPM